MSLQDSAIEIADRLHKAGSELLAGGLDHLLQTYGAVCYTGSYHLNLMAWPDLDIFLQLDTSDEYLDRFLDLGPQIASVCDVVSLRYKNHVQYPEPALPHGLYWSVRAQQSPSLRWKLDIWALPAGIIQTQQCELDRLAQKLNPENRAFILKLKQALLTEVGRTSIFSGYHIYCAVLDHGLLTLERVKQYLREHGVSVQ